MARLVAFQSAIVAVIGMDAGATLTRVGVQETTPRTIAVALLTLVSTIVCITHALTRITIEVAVHTVERTFITLGATPETLALTRAVIHSDAVDAAFRVTRATA